MQIGIECNVDYTKSILCVEDDANSREGRCIVLERLGYHSVSASPRLAQILLSYRKFDLVVLSIADDHELNSVVNLADGADVLVLSESTTASTLAVLVFERLARRSERRA
jgi:CheY-like chemotaxis protein